MDGNCVLVGPLLNTKTVGGDPPMGCARTVRYSAVSNTGCTPYFQSGGTDMVECMDRGSI